MQPGTHRGATITATNTGPAFVTTVLTNESGAYQFASLQPGIYDLKANLTGFQPESARGFQRGGAQQRASISRCASGMPSPQSM